ncbi:MAG: ligase-associated DNA damage response DEXH box helicase [Rhodobacteraceae bacterium]|nr:ligase-associated DNA damage response DEXH box helicase [Paracoccaceae bacterium]
MTALPALFQSWFAERDWQPHPHQLEVLNRADSSAIMLIAPTGGGKTLAGFLPSFVDLGESPAPGLHTLYISPLKALAADMRRNLGKPINDMGLAIRVEDRSGDTSQTRKKAQRADPPHILLTTPESLALLLSYEDAPRIFASLKRVVVDELHALAESKRGDQLMLGLTRLMALAPDLKLIGLSATVEDPPALAHYLHHETEILIADPGPDPKIAMLTTDTPPPWSGGGGRYAIPEVLAAVKAHKTTLIFHNTRAQAEIFFHHLWLANEELLPIGIHHGSLSREARGKVEQAMVGGELKAVVCTGSLDLGLDWGDVDLVIQVGAPKNVKRLVQRIGRANHQYNAPSKALLLPANRWEIIECQAAIEAALAHDLDGDPPGPGPRDVLCQHILIRACSGPFQADKLYREVRNAGAYAKLTRSEFDECLNFVATGGYALRAYDRWQRLRQCPDGNWQLRDPRAARMIRMNIGTIQDTDTLKVRMKGRGGKALGEVEEGFAASLVPGDTFLMGGQIVRFEALREMVVQVSRDRGRRPKIAVFMGTKFSTSTQLSARILKLIHRDDLSALPSHTREWITLQNTVSRLPRTGRLLFESFPHEGRAHSCIYGFAGRGAMQTLGLMLTRRMESAGLGPLGFVATDYATLIWSLTEVTDVDTLLDPDGLSEGLDGWLAENALMKRSFRASATIAGLIQRNLPGQRSTGRQATFSSDILYDTLRRYDPDHLLLTITREEALRGLIGFDRVENLLRRSTGRIDHVRLDHVTPFAAPLFLEVGKVPLDGAGAETLMANEAAKLMEAAGLS